jgi:hypothetical protein
MSVVKTIQDLALSLEENGEAAAVAVVAPDVLGLVMGDAVQQGQVWPCVKGPSGFIVLVCDARQARGRITLMNAEDGIRAFHNHRRWIKNGNQ